MKITNNGSIVKAERFRIDAAIIFILGLTFTTTLTLLLLNGEISLTLFLIPALLSFSMTGFSHTTLKNNKFETLTIDSKNREIQISNTRSIPFHKINKIALTGNIYKSLVLETENKEITIFTGFIILKKFLYIAKILHKEKITLTDNLIGLIDPSKNKMGRKIIIAMLSIWGIITLISHIVRNQ